MKLTATHEVIRKLFPGDYQKNVRHELYTVIHRLVLDARHPDYLPDTTINTYPYRLTDPKSCPDKFKEIEKTFVYEIAGKV